MASPSILKLAVAGAFAAAIAGSPVNAQSTGNAHAKGDTPRLSRTYRLFDTDGDNKVTLAYICAERARLIGAADLDGDGKLSVDEFRRRDWWFQRLHTSTLFDLIDVNGDQVLTAEEISNPSALVQALRQNRRRRGDGRESSSVSTPRAGSPQEIGSSPQKANE